MTADLRASVKRSAVIDRRYRDGMSSRAAPSARFAGLGMASDFLARSLRLTTAFTLGRCERRGRNSVIELNGWL
jgi:hypothetical protein